MAYDVGKMTRELQDQFRLFKRDHRADLSSDGKNRATPKDVLVLLNSLATRTAEIKAKRDTLSNWLPDAGIIEWDRNFEQWTERLAAYQAATMAAAPDDRAAILWNVTAPLLVGFYGGPDAKLPQQTLDAMTPFMLANGLEVDEKWRDERWEMLKRDLVEGLKSVGWNIGFVIAAAAGVAILVTVIINLGSRRR